MINFTAEDIAFVKKAIEIRSKGYFIQSQTLTDHYNRILGKNVANTNCSSCCRSRIQELANALRKWEAEQAKKAQEDNVTNDKVVDTPQEKKEEEPQDVNNSKPHKAKRRKAK